MDRKKSRWCAAPGCMDLKIEKRYFFLFPKEHDRWQSWIYACKRLDLLHKGPEYAHRNCYLCHLHFEEKYYKVTGRAYLKPDAIPTKFFGSIWERSTDIDSKVQPSTSGEINNLNTCTTNTPVETVEEGAQLSPEDNQNNKNDFESPKLPIAMDIEIVEPNTSRIYEGYSNTKKLLEDTPRKRKLRTKNTKLKSQIKTLRETIRRLRTARKKTQKKEKEASELEVLRKLGNKLLHQNFAKLLSVQIDAQIKDNRGRRYSSDFKKYALSLYFLSPRNYKELKKSIQLPSIRSLQLFTQTWNVLPGINEKIFNTLNIKLKSLPIMDRHCILCADEMSLKSHLFYNVSKDEIIGFEDNGNKKTCVPAKSALVIMARSIAGNWKLPVYYLVENTCQSDVLKNIIFEIITKLKNSGAIVHALVTDMGSNFMQLSRHLHISVENATFLVNDDKIMYIFDTPHLLKATRNNLLKHNFQFNNKIASWVHIVQFYERDNKQWIKAAPKLSKIHIEPNNFQRMKVKYAAQVFSNRVAAGMCTQISSGLLPSEAVGTIDLIDHLDKLFDILNSSSAINPKEYGKVFTGSKKQIEYLEEIKFFLRSIKVINGTSHVKVKCFECWQITITGIIQLWDVLKCYNFPYLRTRRINQDCIENFFGSVRQQGGNCLNPTPIQFMRAFKKLFSITFLKHSDTQYCASDTDELLNIIRVSNANDSTINEFIPSSVHKILDIPHHDYYTMDLPEENAFKYVCEYLLKKCNETHSCDICTIYVNENKTVLDDTTLYCSFRAYQNEEGNPFGNLYIANDHFCRYIHKLEEIFVKNFESNCFQKNIGTYLFQLAQSVNFEPPCPNFPTTILIKLFLRMRIYFTLSQHNKSCKGINKKHRKLMNILHL